MRARIAALTTGVVVVVLALTTPGIAGAQEQTEGVAVAPGRQYVSADQEKARVLVVNRSESTVEVGVKQWAYTAKGWVPQEVGLELEPKSFTLDPSQQQEVVVTIPEASTVACRLVGVGAAIKVVQENGIVVRGNALSQLALGGVGSIENDCLEVIPTPAPPPVVAAGPSIPWTMLAGIAGGLLLVGLVYVAGKRRGRKA